MENKKLKKAVLKILTISLALLFMAVLTTLWINANESMIENFSPLYYYSIIIDTVILIWWLFFGLSNWYKSESKKINDKE